MEHILQDFITRVVHSIFYTINDLSNTTTHWPPSCKRMPKGLYWTTICKDYNMVHHFFNYYWTIFLFVMFIGLEGISKASIEVCSVRPLVIVLTKCDSLHGRNTAMAHRLRFTLLSHALLSTLMSQRWQLPLVWHGGSDSIVTTVHLTVLWQQWPRQHCDSDGSNIRVSAM